MKEEQNMMIIELTANGKTTVFELNNSRASRELYDQLPLSVKVEDFGGNEKIFYPPDKLDTAGTPLASNNTVGSLAYYAPWGDVVMFYGDFGSAAGLYALGRSVSGEQYIKDMAGTVRIEKK
ncbi:cyclophilin-like fold protein [Marispirochaeta aestuarii]|uniref:cyclophilin-like fold protein n=1 Tax=Marispirochaeta aestuarii TaxID=1963862 RepID=UPI0018EA2B00|nr:cyclophilin-like fold protein [Marispirochaeta aestuarii]